MMSVRRRTLLQALALPYAQPFVGLAAEPRPRLFLTAAGIEQRKCRATTSRREIWTGRYEWLLHGGASQVRFLEPQNVHTAVCGATLTATPEPVAECILVAAPGEVRQAIAPSRVDPAARISLTVRERRVEFALPERRVRTGLL